MEIKEITNEVNLNNEITNKNEQTNFLESTLGKIINTAIDIGIRAALPEFIDEQVINIKDNLFNYGLKEGITKTIDDAIDIGKSAIGIFTGNFETVSQMQSAVESGGLIDGISSLLDTVVDKVNEKGIINYNIANTIKKGKNVILNSIESNIEEKSKSLIPSQMVMELSEGKAMDIYEKLPEETKASVWVVGADTIVAFGDQIMGKPENRRHAVEMLSRLQGSTHQVYTGVTLVGQSGKEDKPFKVSFYEKTDVTMYPMSREEILAYVDTGEPMDKAGAYGIQGRCAAFIKEIRGDYNNVVGLPVGRLYQEMKKCLGEE